VGSSPAAVALRIDLGEFAAEQENLGGVVSPQHHDDESSRGTVGGPNRA
jgi:hypothetical protein